MDVSGVGAAGPSGTELLSALRSLEGPKGQALATPELVAQSADTIAATLRQLSDMMALEFLEIIDRPPSPEIAARLEGLLRTSISMAAEGNVPQALVKLAEYAELDPRRAEALKSEPGLASLRPEVEQLLLRLASSAQSNAEERLGQATHLLEAAGLKKSIGHEFGLENAVVVASRLAEAGGYANWMYSATLSEMAIGKFGVPPAPEPKSRLESRGKATSSLPAHSGASSKWLPRIKTLWRRAPLLVLLLGWLAIGFVAGSVSAILRTYWPPTGFEPSVSWGFEVWGVGFLALVALGFYAKVRNLGK